MYLDWTIRSIERSSQRLNAAWGQFLEKVTGFKLKLVFLKVSRTWHNINVLLKIHIELSSEPQKISINLFFIANQVVWTQVLYLFDTLTQIFAKTWSRTWQISGRWFGSAFCSFGWYSLHMLLLFNKNMRCKIKLRRGKKNYMVLVRARTTLTSRTIDFFYNHLCFHPLISSCLWSSHWSTMWN